MQRFAALSRNTRDAPVAHLENRKFPGGNRDTAPVLGLAIFQPPRYYAEHTDFIDVPQ